MPFNNRSGRSVCLGLQGGGAHGAFTWGVLDYLLEDGRIRFEGISGASAGAMNATILAHGLMQGGRDGAREALQRFWNTVAAALPFETAAHSMADQPAALAPGARAMMQLTRFLSPEQFNPFDINPLRDILSAQVDFERLRAHSPVELYIAATNARSGKLRLFRRPDIGIDAVLASACLPTLHRSVEIDGEAYWDGAYSANPAVFPLFHECVADDILLVLLAPREHKGLPRTIKDIEARARELAFNATFLREMQMFAALQRRARASWLPFGQLERRIARARFHIIGPHEDMDLAPETKLAVSQRFFEALRDQGRARAEAWAARHYDQLGQRSTVDLERLFS